eukprot:4360401-Karenia_brevis.AAC.1
MLLVPLNTVVGDVDRTIYRSGIIEYEALAVHDQEALAFDARLHHFDLTTVIEQFIHPRGLSSAGAVVGVVTIQDQHSLYSLREFNIRLYHERRITT